MTFERFNEISKQYSKPIKYGIGLILAGSLTYYGVKKLKESNIIDCIRSEMPTSYIQETPKLENTLELSNKLDYKI